MRKHLRKIVVDGRTFVYTTKLIDLYEGGILIKVWKDRKPVHEATVFEESVTPSFVSKLIKEQVIDKNLITAPK